MATKKFLELKEYSETELAGELEATVVQYQKLKFDHAIKGLDNPLDLREIRRDIARLKTEMRSRELAAASPEAVSGRSKIRARRRKQ